MLASKRQEWNNYREYAPQTDVRRVERKSPQLNVGLRRKCWMLAVILVVLVSIATVQSERIINNGYEFVQLQAETRKLEQNNEQLRVEIAKLKSLNRIQSIATGELGMIAPKNVYNASHSPGGKGMVVSNKQESQRHRM